MLPQASRLHTDIARLTEQLYAAQGAAETVKAHNEDLQQQLAAMEHAQPAASPEKVEAQVNLPSHYSSRHASN